MESQAKQLIDKIRGIIASLDLHDMVKDRDFTQVFDEMTSRLAVERIVMVGASAYERHGDECGQQFVYNFEHVPFIDRDWHIKECDIESLLERGDLADRVRKLATVALDDVEDAAMAILDKANTYNPRIGGDGVAACGSHPVETGCFSNTLGNAELSGKNIAAAIRLIDGFVDLQGIKISVKPRCLIVSHDMKSDADEIMKYAAKPLPVIGLKRMKSANWFIRTNISGMMFFERAPLKMTCGFDFETGELIVRPFMRGSFGCADPRALVGAFPERKTKND